MYFCAKIFWFIVFIRGAYFISTKSSTPTQIAEMLWNLTSIAVQSRQRPNPYALSDEFDPRYLEKFSDSRKYYPNYVQNKYSQGVVPPENFNHLHSGGYPSSGNLPTLPYVTTNNPYLPNAPSLSNTQLFMEALDSLARNDNLQCVSRLLCEVTSGTVTSSKQSSTLPFNINTDSFLELLSSLEGVHPSPILVFGKAAALGYTSKGNPSSCTYTYPKCPRNPDALIEYLNNHNGGFFRFFNGINTPGSQNQQLPLYPPYRLQYPHFGKYGQRDSSKKVFAEKRILTNPNKLFYDKEYFKSEIKFPAENNEGPIYAPYDYKLSFPSYLDGERYSGENIGQKDYREENSRSPKKLTFPSEIKYGQQLDFQRPLPNHKAAAPIFPDRTGTGELLVDTEKFLASHNYLDNVRYRQ